MGKNTCLQCGKTSSDKKKICKYKSGKSTGKNASIISLYVCEDCNRQSINAKKICRPKAVSPSFYCKKCGSGALRKKSLCKPRKAAKA